MPPLTGPAVPPNGGTVTVGFSGAASACCAPVLAGVVMLSAVAPGAAASAAVGLAYVAGMVAPLVVLAYVVADRYVSGRARRVAIWSFVVVHPPVLPAYAELSPYPVVVVELDEDPALRMVGNVVATPDGPINEVDPASLRIGLPVEVAFAEVGGMTLPRWIPRP